jgi:deoxyinosine 3'endonuclease (endonuclease V)
MVQNQKPNQKRVRVLTLPHAVGKNGWNGHRVYGGFSFLVNTECVAYLVLRTRNNVRPKFVSVGHRVDLPTSVELLMSCLKHRVPEPTRLADIEVAKLKRST